LGKWPPLEWVGPPQNGISDKDGDYLEGYCLKDKRKVEMKDPQPITMKNGKPATVGTCPFCGTKIYKIGAAPKV